MVSQDPPYKTKKSSYVKIRRTATNLLNNKEILIQIMVNDKDNSVRFTAGERLYDKGVLEDIANSHNDNKIRITALDILHKIEINLLVDENTIKCQKCHKTFYWEQGNPRKMTQMEMLICAKHDLPFEIMKNVSCPHCGTTALVKKPQYETSQTIGKDFCKRCEEGLIWWRNTVYSRAGLNGLITGSVGSRPHDFKGVCKNCQVGYCSKHAPNGICPVCGKKLTE